MIRGIALFLVTALLAAAATVRLYLKDGEYQLVREYKVRQDRVRYYSVERGDWEEIPLDLVDLKKTESEMRRREDSIRQEAAALAAEDKAERDMQKEIERVPIEPGVYLIAGDQLQTIKAAESKVVGQTRKRSILKVLTPIPIVSGKSTLEVEGEHSATVVSTFRPEFYIRLSAEQRFGIVRMGEHKGNRVVEQMDIEPVTKMVVEQQNEVQVFRKQAADGVYKIWPMKPLDPGEYAVVEYTPASDQGLHIQVWDFGYSPGAAPPAKPSK